MNRASRCNYFLAQNARGSEFGSCSMIERYRTSRVRTGSNMNPSDETIFITGFPGFIASRLIRRLALEGVRFIPLVQPALLQRAHEEVEQIASDTGAARDLFQIVEGDITHDSLGMASAELERARRETTTLFHLAAIYDLAVERELAMRVNVGGTRNVNHFAKSIEKLRRYHYVSTCYVAGKRKRLIL